MNTNEKPFTAVHGFLVIEFVSLIIGIAMALTPNKTGSDYSIADHLFDDPSLLEKTVVYFLLTNGIILVIGLCFWIWSRRNRQS